jgi:hypothetical protein
VKLTTLQKEANNSDSAHTKYSTANMHKRNQEQKDKDSDGNKSPGTKKTKSPEQDRNCKLKRKLEEAFELSGSQESLGDNPKCSKATKPIAQNAAKHAKINK